MEFQIDDTSHSNWGSCLNNILEYFYCIVADCLNPTLFTKRHNFFSGPKKKKSILKLGAAPLESPREMRPFDTLFEKLVTVYPMLRNKYLNQ